MLEHLRKEVNCLPDLDIEKCSCLTIQPLLTSSSPWSPSPISPGSANGITPFVG